MTAPLIVVSGATGFVGANLCRYFLARGAQVLAIEGPSDSHWRLPQEAALRRVRVDLCSAGEVRSLLAGLELTAFVHCAAYGAYPSQTDVDRIYKVNVDALRTILEALREAPTLRAFIQAGSSSEYGLNCSAPSEDAPTLPDSHYAVSKVAGTAMVRFYAAKHGVPAWVFRLYSIYGPYEDASRLIPRLLLRAAEGALPPLVNPRISRDFVYVDDLGRAVERLLEKAATLPKGEVFNLGSGKATTLEALVALARQQFNVAEEPKWGSMPDRHWDHADWYADASKAGRVLGWTAETPLAEGLQRTMRWMEENPEALALALATTVLGDAKR